MTWLHKVNKVSLWSARLSTFKNKYTWKILTLNYRFTACSIRCACILNESYFAVAWNSGPNTCRGMAASERNRAGLRKYRNFKSLLFACCSCTTFKVSLFTLTSMKRTRGWLLRWDNRLITIDGLLGVPAFSRPNSQHFPILKSFEAPLQHWMITLLITALHSIVLNADHQYYCLFRVNVSMSLKGRHTFFSHL